MLAPGVRHLDEATAVFQVMLEGWKRQQDSRYLREQTITPRAPDGAPVTVFRDAAPLVTFGVAADEADDGPVATVHPARYPAAVGGAVTGRRPGNRRSCASGRPWLAR
jgi:hypothetical protein